MAAEIDPFVLRLSFPWFLLQASVRRLGLLLFVCLFLPAASQATGTRATGNFLMDYWETDDGLPEDSATAMIQTADGYLWFGTFAGLVRFDGVQFKVFDPGNTPEFPSGGVVNLHLDHNGAIWCSTYKGMVRLANGRWKRFGREEGWTSNFARSFSEPKNGGPLYVTGFDGKILKFQDEKFQEMPPPPGDSGNGYFGHVDREGYFWAAQNRFTGYWTGSEWVRVAPDAVAGKEYGAASARDGGVWILQDDMLRKFNRAGQVFEVRVREQVQDFWSMIEGGSGDLWVCSYLNGVYQVKTNGNVVHYTTEIGLPHNSVRFVFEDREANFWVGTSGGGLMRVRPRSFRNYGTESGLQERTVKSVAVRANGEVVLGTYGKGVARMDPRPLVPVFVPLEKNGPRFFQTLLEDHSGNLWGGSLGDGLFLIESNRTTRVRDWPAGGEKVAALFEDARNRLWVGFGDRVSVREDEKFKSIGLAANGAPLTDMRAFGEEQESGAILAGGDRGLYRLEDKGFVEVRDSKGRPFEQIFCIKTLRDGSIWLGTGKGLVRYRAGEIGLVNEANGLPVRTVSNMIEDRFGTWWLSSNRGIVRVDPQQLEAVASGAKASLECQRFTVSDGLASIECPSGYQPTAARGRDGRLWFATLKGVAVLDPQRLRLNQKPPPVVIESISFIDAQRRRQNWEVNQPAEIKLPPGSSQLDVFFAALSFTAPEKMKFAYKLRRGDRLIAEEEIPQRKVSLNLLPPGHYSLQVLAANNDGVWCQHGATLSFAVLPLYWQTAWFRLGTAAAGAFGLAGVFWRSAERRVRVQREKFEQQRALAEEKARLASVLEGTSDLVGFATAAGRILYINPAGRRLLGLNDEEDVTRLDIADFYSAESRKALREGAWTVVMQKGSWSGEATMRPRSGAEVLTSQVLQVHRDSDGAVLFLSAIIRDVTENRKMEHQLRHAQKMEALGTLASGIAHDFNNVLSAIIGNIELARVDAGPNPPVIESLNEARKAGIRARDLVQQILAFGRRQVQDRKVISLAPVVSEAARLLRSTLPAGIELATRIEPDVCYVSADASQIHQVIINLCTNAWHAIENSVGRIEIRLERVELGIDRTGWRVDVLPGFYARLVVSDTGRGIDPGILDHIFEPFFTTRARGRGTGLGLAVVHGIVKSHDGAIHVTSEVGRGATFELLFPETAPPPVVAEPPSETPAPARGSGEHILYLDDEAPLVFLASRALERIGYRVTGFTDPNEAVAAFRKNPGQFDVVVTDQNMPGSSGLDVAHVFLSLRPDLPVLLTSGYLSDELKSNARAAGVAALIYKPNTVVELREAIHRWVGHSKSNGNG